MINLPKTPIKFIYSAENVVKVGEQENLDITEEIEVMLSSVDSVFDSIS